MKFRKISLIASFIAAFTIAFVSCTKLEERLNSEIGQEEADSLFGGSNPNIAALLKGVYDAMRGPYQDQSRWWAAQQHTTDETIGPTRGGDWDDNGVWRVLHSHRWDADHGFLSDSYRDIGRIVFGATDLLQFNPPAQQAAEARFLRAFANFSWLDGWNQCPYREPGSDIGNTPQVRKGMDALNYIIQEVEAILPALPDGPAYMANKNAARVLLMKCYLNKGVIANRAAPTFDAADMNKVIQLADQITGHTLTPNYYTTFAKNNASASTELIFTGQNVGGSSSGNIRFQYFCTLHYNNNPSGWNGFTTLSDFYDKFEAVDKRRGDTYTGVTDVSGLRVGLLFGQQFNQNGVALQDRRGNQLSFTREVKLKETGNNLEITGIRVVKYPPDYTSGDNVDNDAVYYRYADVLLMKAEAYLRTNQAALALPLVNAVRARSSATPLGSVNLDQLLDERGRELYWEGHRRTDLIRFGKFLNAWQEKEASGPERLLFPIPNRSLAANPNLEQNPGY